MRRYFGDIFSREQTSYLELTNSEVSFVIDFGNSIFEKFDLKPIFMVVSSTTPNYVLKAANLSLKDHALCVVETDTR